MHLKPNKYGVIDTRLWGNLSTVIRALYEERHVELAALMKIHGPAIGNNIMTSLRERNIVDGLGNLTPAAIRWIEGDWDQLTATVLSDEHDVANRIATLNGGRRERNVRQAAKRQEEGIAASSVKRRPTTLPVPSLPKPVAITGLTMAEKVAVLDVVLRQMTAEQHDQLRRAMPAAYDRIFATETKVSY